MMSYLRYRLTRADRFWAIVCLVLVVIAACYKSHRDVDRTMTPVNAEAACQEWAEYRAITGGR